MRRIIAEEVAIAADRAGATLARGVTWWRPDGPAPGEPPPGGPCGCPIGILASTGLHPSPSRLDFGEAARSLGLDPEYARGFAEGFDGAEFIWPGSGPYRDGREDGRAVAAAFLLSYGGSS